MRKQGWEGKLAAYIAEARELDFAWGEHDCALWCAKWIEICRGDNFYSDWLGRYATESEASTLMTSRKLATYADIASMHLVSRPVKMAQRGDIVLRQTGALGICNGLKSHFIAPEGLLTENTLDCTRAWTV